MESVDPSSHHQRCDRGFTLVEILVAIVIIGILATVTVFAVRGIQDRGEVASCRTDSRVVTQAADVYLGERQVDAIPATGPAADEDRYERTLVEAGILKEVSKLYELAADGTVSIDGAICT